ncbi:TPA: hypothetical protein DEP21_04745 [Patescibacteria group bacterium]|nr:hypothetical protein [Candidatus Gracilibacteria bacterium]
MKTLLLISINLVPNELLKTVNLLLLEMEKKFLSDMDDLVVLLLHLYLHGQKPVRILVLMLDVKMEHI